MKNKKISISLVATIIFYGMLFISQSVFAQNKSEYKKVELSGGITSGYFGDKINGNDKNPPNRPVKERVSTGLYGSGVYNFHRFVGLKGEFAYFFNPQTSNRSVTNLVTSSQGNSVPFTQNLDIKRKIFTVMSGLQIKDNASNRRLKPFGNMLLGIGRTKAKARSYLSCTTVTNCTSIPNFSLESDVGFSVAVGGGLDIKLNDRYEVRAFQFDYNPIFLKAGTAHNFRISTGFVIRF